MLQVGYKEKHSYSYTGCPMTFADVPEKVERPSEEQLQRPRHEALPKDTAPSLLGPVCGTLPHLGEKRDPNVAI